MTSNQFKLFGSDEKLSKAIKKFFLQLIILIVAWQLLYNFVLKPSNVPDKMLTKVTTIGAMACINTFLPVDPKLTMDPVYHGNKGGFQLLQRDKPVFIIADICNGLDLFVIYLGLIILLPYYSIKRKIAFGLGGLIVIMLANVIRVTMLYWLYAYHRPMFELNHKYIFTLLLYLLIFCGWVLFTRKGFKHEKN
ncbi:exosortase/archaeosortase family protein [Ferruginibacter sp. SUN002]|uniref:exosortase/archaeosortase family protein n=1 Tax=Ferruginibacter sp. SUN002 TaxID=2937789 RepID=UPI003D366D2C